MADYEKGSILDPQVEIESVLKTKTLIEEAMKYARPDLMRLGIYDDVDDFVYEDCNQVIIYINDDDYDYIDRYAESAKKLADLCYAHESCWNKRLPRTMTKVTGHDYTITEWITAQANLMSQSLRLYAKYKRERAKKTAKTKEMKISTNIAFVSNAQFSTSIKENKGQLFIIATGEITKDCLTDFITANLVAITEVLKEKGLTTII